jgi:transposase
VVSRDRSAAYAQAATEGAPQAGQVADRWHLLKNLREAVEQVLQRHSAAINAAIKALEAPPGPDRDATAPQTDAAAPAAEPPLPGPPVEPVPASPRLQAKRAKRRELAERFDRVHELHERGYPAARIARELGLSPRSVFRYLQRETCPAWHLRGSQRSRLDGYREWIDARIAEGFINIADLHRQLTERGFKGSYGSVYAFVTKRLGAAGKKRERLNAATPPVPRPPSARQLSFEWVRRPEKRKPPEQARLDAIRGCSVELAEALDLADGFAKLIRKQSTGTLSEWLTRGEASPDPALRRFAEGIRSDEASVQAAVTQRWSNGPVEGHVNRLKVFQSYCLHCHSPSLGFELGCEDSPLHSSAPRAPRRAPWARSCEVRRVGMGDARTPGRLETPNPVLLHFVGPHGPSRLGRHDLPRPDPALAAPGGQRRNRDTQFARQLGHPDLARPQPDLVL